ncbi:DivIVA domain-containing protein [Nocardia lijiangensis]|uniref:DivIVA domain-containing protein n=1 Tax=Nocardia lijiangensis TaxID=299618 RepID=UPI000A7A7973|nr:DivIVA domain-containing protein [Nocardia lijiangensis]
MLTLLLYVLIVGLVAAVLFLLASAVFGRGEELGPLPEGTTATVLPAEGISGADVRALRFQQVVRGYKAGEVDWALARLAARIDELQLQLAHARGDTAVRGQLTKTGDSATAARQDTASTAHRDAAAPPHHNTERGATPWPAPSTPEQP